LLLLRSATLKFQAVSAAYQLLTDGDRRSCYDATGEVREEDDNDRGKGDGDSDDVGRGRNAPPRPRRRRGWEGCGDGGGRPYWEDFFRSVFGEMAGAGVRHAELARAYRGSEDKRVDVLRYNRMFGGDIGRVVECVPYGRDKDAGRWRRDIINPLAAAAAAASGSAGTDSLRARGGGGTTRHPQKREEKGDEGIACAEGRSAPAG
jgi:curved DNA-binding protein CbpA